MEDREREKAAALEQQQTVPADMEEISLREILEVILERKFFIILLVILCVAASFIFTRFFQVSSYATATVAMRFPQVEDGLYPSERPFSPSDIISTNILSRVIEELGLRDAGLNSSELREIVTVETLYAPDEEGELTEPRYEYRLRVGEDEQLSPREQRRIVSSIVANYRDANREEFIETPVFPRFALEQEELLEMDYPFIVAGLRSYKDLLAEAALEMSEVTDDFRSSRYGLTFKDISQRLETLEKAEFQDIDSLITHYQLVRDHEMALMRYREMIRELEQEERMLEGQAGYARDLLVEETRGLRRGVLPADFPLDFPLALENEEEVLPEEEDLDLFKILFEDNFFRHLLDVSVETGVSAIDKKTRKEYLQRQMQRLEEAPPGEEREELLDRADRMLEDYVVNLDRISGELNHMMLEFYQDRPKEMIAYVVPPHRVTESGNLMLNTAVAGVLGLMLGIFGAFFQHYWKATSKKKED